MAALASRPSQVLSGPGWRPLLALPLITLLPVLAFAVASVLYLSHQQRSALEREVMIVARHSIQAADLLLEERMDTLGVLAALATSSDPRDFSDHAKRLLSNRDDWLSVALHYRQGSLLAGEARPDAPTPETLARTAPGEGALPLVVVARSDSGRPFLMLRRELASSDQGEVLLTAGLDLAPFSQVLEDLADPNWTVAILDERNVIAGRSRLPEQFAGAEATPSLANAIAEARENFFYAFNQEGDRVYTAFSTSPASGWTAAIGAPAHLIEEPLWRSRGAWLGGGIAALVLASALAWLLTKSVLARQVAERRAWRLESERQTEARLTEIAGHFPGVMFRRVLTSDGRVSFPYLSPGIEDILDHAPAIDLTQPTSLDDLVRNYVLASDETAVREAIRRSAENLSPYVVEARIKRRDGGVRWVRSTATTRREDDGSIVWDGVMMDVTPLKDTERALKAQTEILRTINRINIEIASELHPEKLVQSVLDAGRDVIEASFAAFFYGAAREGDSSVALSAISGAHAEAFSEYVKARSSSLFKATYQGRKAERVADVLQDGPHCLPDRGEEEALVRSYLAMPVVSRSGEVLGWLFFGDPAPNKFGEAAEEVVLGMAAQAAVALENARLFNSAEEELAQRRQAEAQQKTLLAELNHRVKNTLAVVLAIAQQTARTSDSMEKFNEVFRGRIMALADAHTLLTAGEWRSTSLQALVEKALQPYAEIGGDRVQISGPEVKVSPKQALALSLVFHELATNASKYGALSPVGCVLEVDWLTGGEDMLSLHWRECVQCEIVPPKREGFGSKLVATTMSHEMRGSVKRDYTTAGLKVEICFPLVHDDLAVGEAGLD